MGRDVVSPPIMRPRQLRQHRREKCRRQPNASYQSSFAASVTVPRAAVAHIWSAGAYLSKSSLAKRIRSPACSASNVTGNASPDSSSGRRRFRPVMCTISPDAGISQAVESPTLAPRIPTPSTKEMKPVVSPPDRTVDSSLSNSHKTSNNSAEAASYAGFSTSEAVGIDGPVTGTTRNVSLRAPNSPGELGLPGALVLIDVLSRRFSAFRRKLSQIEVRALDLYSGHQTTAYRWRHR